MPKFHVGDMVAYHTFHGGLMVGKIVDSWSDRKGSFIYRVKLDDVHYFMANEARCHPVPISLPDWFKEKESTKI